MAKFVALSGSHRAAPTRAKLVGPIDKSETATITVLLRSRGDRQKLEQWVIEQSAKPLDQQGSLSKADLAKDYGADPDAIDKVENYAATHNLSVVARHAGSRGLSLRGTLGNLLNAFPANVQMYQGPKGSYRGRAGDILVPDELSDVVTGIIGFDTRPKHRAGFRVRISGADGPGGANGEVSTFFAKRYNFPDQYNGVQLDGQRLYNTAARLNSIAIPISAQLTYVITSRNTPPDQQKWPPPMLLSAQAGYTAMPNASYAYQAFVNASLTVPTPYKNVTLSLNDLDVYMNNSPTGFKRNYQSGSVQVAFSWGGSAKASGSYPGACYTADTLNHLYCYDGVAASECSSPGVFRPKARCSDLR